MYKPKRFSRKLYILTTVLLLIAFVLTGCSGIRTGTEAPNFTLSDLDGNQVTLSDLRGKNVFLNFWTTWCEHCVVEMPDIEQIHQEFQNKDLVVLTVNTGEDIETIRKYMEEEGYTFTVLLDSGLDTARLYKVSEIPASYFINNEGIVVSKKVGEMTKAEMLEEIEKLYQ